MNFAINTHISIAQKLDDYKQFVKLRLASLVVFSSGMGYLMAVDHITNWGQLVLLLLGGFLIVGSANGINQIIEKDSDQLMLRTANRPIATGRMQVNEGILVSLIMGVMGVGIIAVYMNYLSAVLGFAALCSYAFIYTPLKKKHPIAVLVGAFPGALPTLIGYTAAAGTINYEAMLLFTIQFIWQFPHFWAIAWRLHEDYQRAGIRLLPESGEPGKKTAMQTLIYTSTLIPVGLLISIMGYTGWISGVISLICALYFTYTAWLLYQNCDRDTARRLMFGSYIYLPVVQLAWAFDRL